MLSDDARLFARLAQIPNNRTNLQAIVRSVVDALQQQVRRARTRIASAVDVDDLMPIVHSVFAAIPISSGCYPSDRSQ